MARGRKFGDGSSRTCDIFMYECYRLGRISKRIYAASLLKGDMRGKSAGKRGSKVRRMQTPKVAINL